ncbi:MAG TPA: hypothetical protein VGK78_06870 [Nocardioides sp.]|uniref:hypothetical protein n=1 Tax=Nocardioides sp. TaxID=35761 RepID=UPI002F3E8C24
MTTITATSTTARSTTLLWQGAFATGVLAGLAPRVNAVIYDHAHIWYLDPEARVLLPIVVALPFVLAGTIGRWAWRGPRNRPAPVGLVLSLASVAGVVAFFLSAPIVLGGIAATLGLEGRRRADLGRGRMATAAVVVGVLACVGGTALWLAGI